MKYFVCVLATLANLAFGTEILTSHVGKYRCLCLHEGCKSVAAREVRIHIDAAQDRLAINYGEETQSGAPARTIHTEGSVLYTLASGGKVGFTSDGELNFGWGKLWTCHRLP